MYANGLEISYSWNYAGIVFDVRAQTVQGSPLFITDYVFLDKKIILVAENEIELGGSLTRNAVTSIAELKTTFEDYISKVTDILAQSAFDFSISKSEQKLLAEQLVFDILFDKYLKESQLMTRNGYSTYMGRKLYTDSIQRMACARAINENLRRGMEDHYNMMKYSALREQISMLGVDPDKYDEYYNPNLRENSKRKKPKFIWDYFYYNYGRNLKNTVSDDDTHTESKYGRGTITSKQYRRQFTREGRNYSYEEIIEDLKNYHDFISKLLPVENESYEKYFCMSMDYYVLESYKRIDFIFKLIASLPQNEIMEINKNHFLIKRFHPLVLVPCVDIYGNLCYGTKHNYYKPLFIMEDELLKQIRNDNTDDYSKYGIRLQKYQFIRAKTYELFKYHCAFSSNDYVEIKEFLQQSYNMRLYHESTELWKTITDEEWNKRDKKANQKVIKQIQQLLSINEALFWKSSDRIPNIPKE